MNLFMYEVDTGWLFGPASEEHIQEYNLAKAAGKEYFMYPYHGYHLRMRIGPKESPDTPSVAYFKQIFPK
jgi:hypothetical protein